ncbi:hypothetical protein [Sorangium sp. So ce117]
MTLVRVPPIVITRIAPIVPPGDATILGVKGARERLQRLGWKGA